MPAAYSVVAIAGDGGGSGDEGSVARRDLEDAVEHELVDGTVDVGIARVDDVRRERSCLSKREEEQRDIAGGGGHRRRRYAGARDDHAIELRISAKRGKTFLLRRGKAVEQDDVVFCAETEGSRCVPQWGCDAGDEEGKQTAAAPVSRGRRLQEL